MTLTKLEREIINVTLNNEYNDESEANYPVWMSVVLDYVSANSRQARGAIASLVKKGFAHVQDFDFIKNDTTIAITDSGYNAFKESQNKEK